VIPLYIISKKNATFFNKKSLKNFKKFFLNGVFSYWFFVLYIRAMITFYVCISCMHFICAFHVWLYVILRRIQKRLKNFLKFFLKWCFLFCVFCPYLLVTVRNYQKYGKFYVYCFCGGFALNRDIFRIFVNIKKCTVLEWLCHSFMRNSAQEPCKHIILPMCMRRIREKYQYLYKST